MSETDLNSYTNRQYDSGPKMKKLIWYYTNVIFFLSPWLPFSALKRILLRLFGAKIGNGVVLKPRINIKYPWFLEIGDYTWIGEGVWIDNLAHVKIGKNVCLSQGSMLLCGNHDYKKTSFDLITEKITIEDGVWIGAQAIVCPGVKCQSHSVLGVKSVATQDLEPFTIYHGSPAASIRKRIIS